MLKALEHPNIIHLADVFETEPRIYMVRACGDAACALLWRVCVWACVCACIRPLPARGIAQCVSVSVCIHARTRSPPYTKHTPPQSQVMELMRGGELFDYVVEKGTLSEEEACSVVRRLASAIAYMHANEIIHRDLKPGTCVCACLQCLHLLPPLRAPVHTRALHRSCEGIRPRPHS